MARFLVRFGEIGVKSPPVRRRFIGRLADNIRSAIDRAGAEADVEETWSRVYVRTDDPDPVAGVLERTFGVVSLSRVWLAEADPDRIADRAVDLLRDRYPDGDIGAFAVRPRRSGEHDFSSRDVGVVVGAEVEEAFDAPVDLDDPDTEVFVEVRDNSAYVFFEKVEGPGGLPVASQGRVAVAWGPGAGLAAWLVMKRGAEVVPVVRAAEEDGPKALVPWAPNLRARVVGDPVEDAGEWLAVVDRQAGDLGADAIAVGYVLGDGFADRLKTINQVTRRPVLTPLAGLDEDARRDLADRTGLPGDAQPPPELATPVQEPTVDVREVRY